MSKHFALIIEDEPDLATIFAEALKTAGFETKIIADGQVALTELETTVPNVVVLDLHLPNVSGQDILKQIRADDRFEKTHVLIATADASIAEMLEDQADLVLLKPISFMQLQALAKRFLVS
jgi:DNA-binding response OmpR family regulator